MRPQHIMFLGLVLAAGTLISLTFGGDWLGDSDVEIANSLTVFKDANILDVWSITVPNPSFFFVGLKALMMADFAFFEYYSGLGIVQWIFELVIASATLWGLYSIIIGVVQSALGRR